MRAPPPLEPRFVEGSNPPTAKRLQLLGPNRWRVRPWLEYPEGTRVGLYGFRLDLLVRNRAARAQALDLEVAWHHEPKNVRKYLDYLHVETAPGRWQLVHGKVRGTTARFALRIPPGDHWLAFYGGAVAKYREPKKDSTAAPPTDIVDIVVTEPIHLRVTTGATP